MDNEVSGQAGYETLYKDSLWHYHLLLLKAVFIDGSYKTIICKNATASSSKSYETLNNFNAIVKCFDII